MPTQKDLQAGSLEPRPDTAGRRRGVTGLPVLGAATAEAAATPAMRPARAALRKARRPVVSFVSLGCAKNLVDSEKMLGELVESGAMLSGDESAADTVVVNTCGFLESSRTEAMEIIAELAERKRAGGLRRIVVAGCLVQRDGERIREAIPEVDALIGVNNRSDVVQTVWRMDRDAEVDLRLGDYHGQPWNDQGRVRLTPRHYAYVRVSEGCNQKCTFCTIPSIRGPMHSKSPADLVAECRELIDDGAREILLIGQDTTSYGADSAAEGGLAGLLRTLNRECADARWLRLMYVYPSVLTDDILDAIAESERFVKYIDMPLQHINDRMLKRMHRRVTRKQTEALLERIRRRIPGVAIRTTFIVGFPDEQEAEFQELCDFVRSYGFDAAGAFKYSREPGTPAGRMKEQLDPAVIAERHERLMLTQQEVAFRMAAARRGQEFEVIIDSATAGAVTARAASQAPEVDSICHVRGLKRARPGQFHRVRCSGADGYDLIVAPA